MFPLKTGDWGIHRTMGRIRISTVNDYEIKYVNSHGDSFRISKKRGMEMIIPCTEKKKAPPYLTSISPAKREDPNITPHTLPLSVGDQGMHKVMGLVEIVKINDGIITFINPKGDSFKTVISHGVKMITPLTNNKDNGSKENFSSDIPVIANEYEIQPRITSNIGWGARPYQTEALRSISKAFNNYDQVILALPTGSGKTFVASKWACDHIVNKGGKVIWVAHRAELLDQAYATFLKLLPPHMSSEITWWAGGKEKNPYGKVILVSIMAAKTFPPISTDLLVIDEAHHEPAETYQKFQKIIHFKKSLGLTATPKRLDEKSLNYETIAYQKTFMSLVHEKWLSRPDPVLPRTGMKYDLDVRMDDFSEDSLRSLNSDRRNEFIVKHWLENSEKYEKVLVFAINREHAKKLTECFRRYTTEKTIDYIVSGEGSISDRKTKVSLFKNGGIDILINCKIFTEGFDCPDVKTIFITRPTLSVSLYLQMIGRGTRITSDKNSFFLVDFQDDLGKFQNQLVSPWILGDELTEVKQSKRAETSITVDDRWPNWLKEDIDLAPVDINLIAGYVQYKHENGRDDGFIVHVDDEKIFLEFWDDLQKHAEIHEASDVAIEAIRSFRRITTKRIPLQGLISASIASVNGDAKYIKLKSEPIVDDILQFLNDVDLSDQDEVGIKKQFSEIHAILKFTIDEIDDDLYWCIVFENEKKDFDNAMKEYLSKKNLRGIELKNQIKSVYNEYLIDTQILEYYWERFCLNIIKNPSECIYYTDN